MKTMFLKAHRWLVLLAACMLAVMGLPAALSADAQVSRKEAGLQSYPVAASTTIYKGAMVCTNTSGYLVAAADTNGYKFVGIAAEQIDNSSGSNGDLSCKVYTVGSFLLTATSITQAMVGECMYVADDATFDDTSSNFVCCGKLVEYVSATQGWVDITQQGIQLNDSAARLYRTIATGYTDELGAIDYGDLTTNGASGGHIYGRGSWINLAASSVPGAGHIHVPWEGGIYDAGATLTNARLVFGAQYQAILSGSPATLHAFRFNTTQAITAIIAAANSNSVGYAAGAGTTSTKCGDIPIADVAGGVGVVYVRCYDAAG